MKKNNIPLDGWAGLRQNMSSDSLSGFLVFLLALPLSLGIAQASDFPAVYGLVTAMVGGVVVSLLAGSPLTIKGPAAGLIVIVAGAVAELGQGNAELGWKLALGAIVVAGFIQILFGVIKLGSFSDFFPLSTVHGMLTAIGIIIMAKQLHVIAGMNPVTSDGTPMFEPIDLMIELRYTFTHFFEHKDVAIIGLISLAIVFGWPMIPVKSLKKIPSALIVLLVAIPMAGWLGVANVAEIKDASGAIIQKGFSPLLSFKQGLTDIIGVRVSFDGFSQTGTFVKYVIMFALVGSLEALLTVKAIDLLDPYRRRSNTNKDLIALGLGNIIAGVMGGLPMISEVARSSANVSNGGKTRWSNFFHGFFILLFLVFAVHFSDIIPKSALAAMLIGVGWKLAHPREFGHLAKVGRDHIAIFLATIIITLTTDLLVGIASGILLKLLLHIARAVPLRYLFTPRFETKDDTIRVYEAAIFSNFIPIKRKVLSYTFKSHIKLDFSKCSFIDYTVMESLHHLKDDFQNEGGSLTIMGIEEFKPVSNHPLATRRKKRSVH